MIKIFQNKKRAAMFGLDARIALAIFGALSVIAGAALFSAIQKTKTIAFIRQIEEVSKAVEAYRIDTGTVPVFQKEPTSRGFITVYSRLTDITTNAEGKAGWRGPYLPMTVYNNMSFSDGDYLFSIKGLADRKMNSFPVSSSNLCNLNSGECNLYIRVQGTGEDKAAAVNLFNRIEEYFDGPLKDESYRTGKIRFDQPGNTGLYLDPDSGGDPAILYLAGPYPR